MTIDANAELFLARSLRLGRVVLVVGAGFSHDATSLAGTSVPLGSDLKALLWEIAFPGQDPDTSSLGEVFEVAVHKNRTAVLTLLRDRLTVDRESIPAYYRSYMELPWHRIYTLNFDNLFPALAAHFGTEHEIRTVSGISETIPEPSQLSCVYLNGTLHDFPNLTFSPPQYGERLAAHESAYSVFVRDVISRPTIFIGTQLDEPPLWQHLAMRGDPPGRGRNELRPRSYLVTPELAAAKHEMLQRYNIVHVPMYTEEFTERYLASHADPDLVRPQATTPSGEPWTALDGALTEPPQTLPDFLLGREPTWADVSEGFAIERQFEVHLADKVVSPSGRVDAMFVTGTAGSGKSTTLRRIGLALNARGIPAAWLRLDAPHSLARIRTDALQSNAEVLLIDHAERFGHRGVETVRAIAETEGRTCIAAYSSSAFDELGVADSMSGLAIVDETVPHLTDPDISDLLDALTDANRLGKLTNRPRDEQVRAFRDRAGRQLLVAMLEATTGEQFELLIARECDALAEDLKLLYAVCCVATAHRFALRMDELLAVSSDYGSDGLEQVTRLTRQHLALRSPADTFVARHPVVASQALTHYRGSGQLGAAIAQLAFVMASRAPSDGGHSREQRLLTKLISHDSVTEIIQSRAQIREFFYGNLEGLLSKSAHYWLQRGSYELERGDIRLAENFLATARGIAEDNFMVATEWAYLMMERATREPNTPRAADWFEEGFDLLLDVIDRWGPRTPNTYVVLAQLATRWVRGGRPSKNEAIGVLEVVKGTMTSGSATHGHNRHFAAARDEVERAYLELALAIE